MDTDFLREWAVDKTFTDKLESVLNTISDKGRYVYQLDWVGGRDWVVVSYRDVAYPVGEDTTFTIGV